MRYLIGLVAAVVVATVVVVALRNTTMTVHSRVPRHSTLVVDGTARSRSANDRAETLNRALADQCVAETADRSSVVAFRWHRDHSFVIEITPSLDEPDQRQLRGCLSDLRMPRLLVSVDHMRSIT